MNLVKGPIDYSQVKDTFDKIGEGYKFGLDIRQGQAAKQKQVDERQLAMQMKQDLELLASNPKASAKDYASMMVKYPAISEHLKSSWDVLKPEQQENKIKQASQVHAATLSGNYDVAKKLLTEQAEALRNAGQESEAKATEAMAKMIEFNPEIAKTTTALTLSALMGSDKYADTFSSIETQRREAEKLPGEKGKLEAEAQIKQIEAQNAPDRIALENELGAANVKNIYSQIGERSKRLNLDKDKFTSDVQQKLRELNQKNSSVDDGAKKIINDSTVAAIGAAQSADQMSNLADKLQEAASSSGVYAKGGELYKKVTGNQDSVTLLRQEYIRLRNTQAVKTLPPGPATDRDIDLALKGFPEDTANPETMASFLRGMSKLSSLEEINESAKAEWVNATGHLGKAKTDINIDGVEVPAGTNFINFAKTYVPKKLGEKEQEKIINRSLEKVKGRNYLKYSNSGGW
jgi:hypothetical protein